MITENKITDNYFADLRYSFIYEMGFAWFILAGFLFYIFADASFSNINVNYLHDHASRNLSTGFIILLFVFLIQLFARIVRFLMRRRLIVSIEYSTAGKLGIITFNNKSTIFNHQNTSISKGDADWILRFFMSSRNNVFKSLPLNERRGITITINSEKFYLVPGIFESQDFPF